MNEWTLLNKRWEGRWGTKKSSAFFYFHYLLGWEWEDGLRLTARPLTYRLLSGFLMTSQFDTRINIYTHYRVKNNNHVDFNLTRHHTTWTEHHTNPFMSFFLFFDSSFFIFSYLFVLFVLISIHFLVGFCIICATRRLNRTGYYPYSR